MQPSEEVSSAHHPHVHVLTRIDQPVYCEVRCIM